MSGRSVTNGPRGKAHWEQSVQSMSGLSVAGLPVFGIEIGPGNLREGCLPGTSVGLQGIVTDRDGEPAANYVRSIASRQMLASRPVPPGCWGIIPGGAG